MFKESTFLAGYIRYITLIQFFLSFQVSRKQIGSLVITEVFIIRNQPCDTHLFILSFQEIKNGQRHPFYNNGFECKILQKTFPVVSNKIK
jgi:hypothetical protein